VKEREKKNTYTEPTHNLPASLTLHKLCLQACGYHQINLLCVLLAHLMQ
jgi:hypothetical protein